MLNEYLELEAYIKNPRTDKPRIQPNYFTGSFGDVCELNGLEQILTTVARGYLFSYCPKEYEIEDKVENTLYILCKWCGFEYDGIENMRQEKSVLKWFEDYPEADGWLKNFWNYQFDTRKKVMIEKKGSKKNVSEVELSKEKLWAKTEEKWKDSLNSSSDFQGKKITYKNVIANAFEEGPLKNRYLAFKKDRNTTKVKGDKRFDYLYELEQGKKTVQEQTKYKFLKSIVNYLVLKEQHPKDQVMVLFRSGQLLGWYGQDDVKNDDKIRYFPFLFWKGETIFTRGYNRTNYVKLGMNQEYLEEFDFKLIEKNQMEEYKEMYWVMEDCGHGENLRVVNN